MTLSQIQTLAAKDLLVKLFGETIFAWPISVWEEAVRQEVQHLDDLSPGKQSLIRMEYHL